MTPTCLPTDAPTDYTVVLSTETTEAEQVAAMQAAVEWEYAVRGLQLNVTVADWCRVEVVVDRDDGVGFWLPYDQSNICVRPSWTTNYDFNSCVNDTAVHFDKAGRRQQYGVEIRIEAVGAEMTTGGSHVS